jgi:SAM-dependent methyltransferase
MAYWDELAHHVSGEEMWMGHPVVRARINRRVTGDPALWPTAWLARWLAARAPLARCASVGSGTGALERDLVRQGVVARVEGVEISPACVAEAERLAAVAGMSDRIAYRAADARAWLEQATGFDAVFFHGSLHHFDRLDELLGAVARALAPGGLLYLDEYVGPAAGEWGLRHLLLWNAVYRLWVPRRLRRARLVRAPANREDPTESIASSAIPAAVARRFRVLERRDYGGNLLAPLYPYLRGPRHDPPAPRSLADGTLERLLDLEELLLRHPRWPGASSHHTVMIATPRPAPARPGREHRLW